MSRVNTNRSSRLAVLVGLLVLAVPGIAAAPGLINYQGILTDDLGAPVGGHHDLTFRIYPDAAGGTPLWQETHIQAAVEDGLFTVILGSVTTFPASLFDAEDRWIGITMDANPEFAPRMRMTSVPWAMRAAVADTALVAAGSDGDWIVSGDDMWSGVSGNVGVGTDAPQAKFDVLFGALRSSRSPSQYLEIRDVDATGAKVTSMSPELNKKSLSFHALHDGTGSPAGETCMFFSVGSVLAPTEALAIRESGNVGVGVHDPAYRLDVAGTVQMSSFRMQTGASAGHVLTTDSSGNGTWQPGGGPDNDWTVVGDDMYSAVSGNVGIGTTAPGKRLQVGNNTVANTEGMIRLASRSGTQGSNRTWDIGVPETDAVTTGPGYSFVIDDTNAGTDPEFMVKYGTGRVGVGTVAPEAQVHIYKASDATAEYALKVETVTWNPPIANHHFILINGTHINAERSSGTDDLHLNYDATGDVTLAYGGGNVGIGTSSPDAKLEVVGTAKVSILEISGADLAEKFPTSEETRPGMVVGIDPSHPGQLCLTRQAYDRRVAGVVSGANDLSVGAVLGNLPGSEKSVPIALSGRVWVWCDTATGGIEPGDMLTTADRPGHAMRASDPGREHGAILGKAMTGLAQGRTGLVLVLVNLQ